VAWYKDNSEAHTHPVGTKKPNTWGIYDVLGNVWEWTLKYAAVVRTPLDEEITVNRARVRGGAYDTELKFLHTAEDKDVAEKYPNVGFRCIKIKSGSQPQRGTNAQN
jgi:formylglycine-generating enzyme required for sulfatase activity